VKLESDESIRLVSNQISDMGSIYMKKIMIVDDSVIIRQRLKELFKNKGFEVVAEVESGEKAIIKFRDCKPDIITMDITLPGISGIEAVKKLIEIDSNVKIIMITAMGERTTVLQAIKLGAVNFIVKPFQEGKVMSVIREVLGTNPDEQEQCIKEIEDDELQQEHNEEKNNREIDETIID
jgi:Response regulator containing CheY-like receiver, AAA-type ATPase, and DNA-binding domains